MAKNKKSSTKKKFEVQKDETIDACLDRMKKEGYTPIRRVEEPIFEEIVKNSEKTYQPVGRKVVFDAVMVKDEH